MSITCTGNTAIHLTYSNTVVFYGDSLNIRTNVGSEIKSYESMGSWWNGREVVR